MNIKLKKIIRPLDFGGYASELSGQVLSVWVNPTRQFTEELDALQRNSSEMLNELRKAAQERSKDDEVYQQTLKRVEEWHTDHYLKGLHDWYARLWSQDEKADSHWTVDELLQIDEQDPALYQWMRESSMQMIVEHRKREKKKLSEALGALAMNQPVDDERLNAFGMMRLINKAHGGPVVTVWDVEQLDDAWLDFFQKMMVDLPAQQAREKAIKNKFSEFEREYESKTKVKVH